MAGSKGNRGGRGQSTALVVYNPGGGAQPQQAANLTDEQKISNALGTQGIAKTLQQAALDVNPNFRSGKEWQTNCQRCAWAVEMSRRGYDVEAMPRTSDDTYARMDTSLPNSFLNVAEGGLKTSTVQGFYKKSATEFKAAFTNKYDVGARGMIIGTKFGASGHVFNWEIVAGKNGKQVRFYDGQVHGLINKQRGFNYENVSVTYIQKHWDFISEARMDNVNVTPLIADFVKPRS